MDDDHIPVMSMHTGAADSVVPTFPFRALEGKVTRTDRALQRRSSGGVNHQERRAAADRRPLTASRRALSVSRPLPLPAPPGEGNHGSIRNADGEPGKLSATEARLRRYCAGVGLAAGGSTPNELAVMQVIEKLPVVATSATRLSTPMVFSAAA